MLHRRYFSPGKLTRRSRPLAFLLSDTDSCSHSKNDENVIMFASNLYSEKWVELWWKIFSEDSGRLLVLTIFSWNEIISDHRWKMSKITVVKKIWSLQWMLIFLNKNIGWSDEAILIFNWYFYLLTSHCSLKKVGSVSRVNASTFSDNVGDQIRISLSIPDVARIEANLFGWTQLTIAESPLKIF